MLEVPQSVCLRSTAHLILRLPPLSLLLLLLLLLFLLLLLLLLLPPLLLLRCCRYTLHHVDGTPEESWKRLQGGRKLEPVLPRLLQVSPAVHCHISNVRRSR
jgi:hypothetical protein